jgi:enterochelin esterase-like enzyme
VAHEGGEVLREAGHDVTVRSRVGGHDYAWWRYELVETLSAFAR